MFRRCCVDRVDAFRVGTGQFPPHSTAVSSRPGVRVLYLDGHHNGQCGAEQFDFRQEERQKATDRVDTFIPTVGQLVVTTNHMDCQTMPFVF